MNIATVQKTAVSLAAAGDSFTGISVSITNNLTVPLDIFDVFNPSTAGQAAPYIYTRLATVAAGTTGTVKTLRRVAQLEAMYTGAISELQGWYYYQFPIKYMSGTQFNFDDSTPPPLAYTVEQADWQAMIQSFLFHKFAMANPDSALTKNLYTALKSSDAKVINAFFAGTQNFKNCTLSSWNGVMTWLTMFTSGWQGPYYIYEAAPDSPPANYVPALLGTVNIVSTSKANSATLTLCSQNSSGKVQPLSPAQTSDLVMAGDGTLTDSAPGKDIDLSLTPVWINAIQTTMKKNVPTTSYVSGPVFTGTVAGKKVVSTQTLIPLPGQGQSQSLWDKVSGFASKNFNTLCQLVGLAAGLLMLAEAAKKGASEKQAAEEKAKSESASDKEFQAEKAKIEADSSIADSLTPNADTIEKSTAGMEEGYSQIRETQQKGVLEDAIASKKQALTEEVNNQLEEGMTPTEDFETAFQNTMDSFQTAQQQLDEGNLTDAGSTMSDAAASMQQTLDQSTAQMQQSEVDALQNSADAVDAAARQADALNEAQEQRDKNMQDGENDSGFDGEDATPEAEPVPEAL